jgi:hypothetical protein
VTEQLTKAETRFLLAIQEGLPLDEAYVKGFTSARRWKPETVQAKAEKLLNSDKIQHYLKVEAEPEPKKNKGGRPSKYDPKYIKQAIEFFDKPPGEWVDIGTEDKPKMVWQATPFPTKAGFAVHIGIAKQTLFNWAKEYEDFGEVFDRLVDYQEAILVPNALQGGYNPAVSIFMSKNLFGFKDKIEHTGDSENPIHHQHNHEPIEDDMSAERALQLYRDGLGRGPK